MIRVLVTGLPGSGKTRFSEMVRKRMPLKTVVFNGDLVRAVFNDWNFSHESRTRQAIRMSEMWIPPHAELVLYDFVCPRDEYRDIINADFVVWVNTIKSSKYGDTNQIWEDPKRVTYSINEELHFEYVSELLVTHALFYKFSSN
jgi:adenylylsulfate kinase